MYSVSCARGSAGAGHAVGADGIPTMVAEALAGSAVLSCDRRCAVYHRGQAVIQTPRRASGQPHATRPYRGGCLRRDVGESNCHTVTSFCCAVGERHLPVDAFRIRLVRELASLGWSGAIVLEYLPWHHYRLPSDRELVEQGLVRDVDQAEIPPPCDAYKNAPEMWHHGAPEPR